MQHELSVTLWSRSTATKCSAAHNLHWLPVYSRTDFELATLCFKSHVMRQPDYLAVTLDQYEPLCSLRSSTQHLLSVLFCNTSTGTSTFIDTVLGKHRFSVAVSLVWNSLPLDLRTANSLPAFKNNLKIFLFRRDFKYSLCHRAPLIQVKRPVYSDTTQLNSTSS